MSNIKIFWNPSGFELDSLGTKTYSGPPADGDTPYIRVPIRMLSIDTPETNYPTIGKPSNTDDRLKELGEWIEQGIIKINKNLADYLVPILKSGKAGSAQEEAGEKAKAHFKTILDQRLTKPNGRKRSVFVYTTPQPFDWHGRLLAYMAPKLSNSELATATWNDKVTFNFQMVESGWAAPFIIYPSMPKHKDLIALQDVAKKAFENKTGAWGIDNYLPGYDWRMCVKLYKQAKKLIGGQINRIKDEDWIVRYCMDMETLEVVDPQEYVQIKPYNRIFIWPQDVKQAVANLNLVAKS